MSFLFKSKKGQDRALASRDGTSGSQGSAGSGRGPRDEKGARSTPTGSVNSMDNDAMAASPDRNHGRRGGSLDQTQQQPLQPHPQPQAQSDLPVSHRNSPSSSHLGATSHPWGRRGESSRLTLAVNSFEMGLRRQLQTPPLSTPGLNGGSHIHHRIRARSLDMAPLSIHYRPRKVTST